MTDTERGKDLTNAVDKREWLAERGLAKAGTRGKFSNAAREALAEAEKNGVVFIDKKATIGTVSVMGEDGKITSEKREVDIYAPHPEPIREGNYLFVGESGFKLSVNASEACSSCLHSFGWCYCEVPTFSYWKTGEVLSLASAV